MKKTIRELLAQCEALGLTVKASKILADGTPKVMKKDYVEALRAHFMVENYPNGIPKHLAQVLELASPMLCARFNDLKPEQQRAIWEDSEWIFEPKWDGVRMLAVWNAEERGLHFYSRNVSVVHYCPIEYDNILHDVDEKILSQYLSSFIVDCEVLSSSPNVSTILGNRGVITETHLQAVAALLGLNREDSLAIQAKDAPLFFRSFDVLKVNDEWVMDKPYKERRVGLETIIGVLQLAGLKVYPTECITEGKREFYDGIVGAGGEGIVAKHVNSPYVATTSRKKGMWVKIKRTMRETLSALFGDTLDGWISGYILGDEKKAHADLVGTLCISIFVKRTDGTRYIHEIARMSGLTDELRKAMTEAGPLGTPQMKEEYLNQCVEIDGQCISARSKRLRHARLLRFRPDKYADLCEIDEDILHKLIL